MLGRAAAVGAEDADAVGVVDHDPGVVFFRQGDDTGEIGDVPFHAENAVDDDELPDVGVQRGQEPFEVRHVVVLVFIHVRER